MQDRCSEELQKENGKAKASLRESEETINCLEKTIREYEHIIKVEKAESTAFRENSQIRIRDLEELVENFKCSNSSNTAIKLMQNRILELDNELYLGRQKEMELIRAVQDRNIEIDELKIENQKLSLNIDKDNAASKHISDVVLENLDDETNNLITALMHEIADLKKENSDFQERALERLADKEVEKLEIQEELEKRTDEYRRELNDLMLKMAIMYNSPMSIKKKLLVFDDANCSIDSLELDGPNQKILKELEMQLYEANCELELKTQQFNLEKNKITQDFEMVENELKSKINLLENELCNLKIEVQKYELEKTQMQLDLNSNSNNSDCYYQIIEEYQVKLKKCEESKERLEINHKQLLKRVNQENEEINQKCKTLQAALDSANAELNRLSKEYNQKFKELKETHNLSLLDKEKQIRNLTDKSVSLTQESTLIKAENERAFRMGEHFKNSIAGTSISLKQLKEEHSKELKRLETDINEKEKKYQSEIDSLMKQIHETKNPLLSSRGRLKSTTAENTLFDALTEISDEDFAGQDDTELQALQSKLISMEGSNLVLKNQVTELKSSIINLTKELDHSNHAMAKLKQDYKESKEVYLSQISDLQKHCNKKFTERASLSLNLDGEENSLSLKQIQILADLKKKNSNLKAHKKYLDGHINLLKKEITHIRNMRESDMKYYKSELNFTEQLVINSKMQYAAYVIEKDEELNNLNNLNRILLDKLGLKRKK